MLTPSVHSGKNQLRAWIYVDNLTGTVYDTIMKKYQIVIDTNVLIAALSSRRGASYRLFMLLGSAKFGINISVPLILEYESIGKRLVGDMPYTEQDVEDVIEYFCSIASQWKIYYLWRMLLQDPKDELILELAIVANCDVIVTFNKRDFRGAEQFGIEVMTPKEFLEKIGELS